MVNQLGGCTIKEGVLFSMKIMQMSKALWRAIEEDVELLTSPYEINLNEYHIMVLVNNIGKSSVSKIATLGLMHISTAFNFSKKLQEKGYVKLLKERGDMRNTYIILTQDGKNLLSDIISSYNPDKMKIHEGISSLKKVYGMYPEFLDLEAVIRLIYGEELIKVANHPLQTAREDLLEQESSLGKNK